MAVAGAFILGCAGTGLTAAEAAFFRQARPFGFILFARNLDTPAQIRRLTGDLRAAVGRDAPILIDQEGGRVARLGAPHWRTWKPPLDQVQGSEPEHAARGMWLRARTIAAELRDLGIDVNCAPLADIADDTTHAVLRNRCYGTDPATVTGIARAVADGLLAGGVAPVLKHIPGHGRATLDSHLALPVVNDSAAELRARDFAPFKALAGLPMGMTAHLVYTAFDADRPATTSPVMIRLIREEIGFGGLLMTDDISMQALAGSVAERSAAARAAGCDLVLHCNGDLAEMRAVAEVSGRLDGPALVRAAAALAARDTPEPFDARAAEAELRGILGGPGNV